MYYYGYLVAVLKNKEIKKEHLHLKMPVNNFNIPYSV